MLKHYSVLLVHTFFFSGFEGPLGVSAKGGPRGARDALVYAREGEDYDLHRPVGNVPLFDLTQLNFAGHNFI